MRRNSYSAPSTNPSRNNGITGRERSRSVACRPRTTQCKGVDCKNLIINSQHARLETTSDPGFCHTCTKSRKFSSHQDIVSWNGLAKVVDLSSRQWCDENNRNWANYVTNSKDYYFEAKNGFLIQYENGTSKDSRQILSIPINGSQLNTPLRREIWYLALITITTQDGRKITLGLSNDEGGSNKVQMDALTNVLQNSGA